MEENQFKTMSDEQLVAMTHSPGMITGKEGPAAAELYRRQKVRDDKNTKIQKWILRLTIPILLFTLIGVIVAILSYFK